MSAEPEHQPWGPPEGWPRSFATTGAMHNLLACVTAHLTQWATGRFDGKLTGGREVIDAAANHVGMRADDLVRMRNARSDKDLNSVVIGPPLNYHIVLQATCFKSC